MLQNAQGQTQNVKSNSLLHDYMPFTNFYLSLGLYSLYFEILQYILKMIEQSKRQVSSLKMQWSPQEIQRLNIIYNEQILKGKKKVWKRVQQRINQHVRVTCRQAIQYKWKNYCACPNMANNKICKNQLLIEQLLTDLPYKGYSQLKKCEYYKNITQSNLKNAFYSNIRSLAKFILKNFNAQQVDFDVLKMFSNRNFLRIMDENNLNIIKLRRSINSLKLIIKNRRQSKCRDNDIMQIKELEQRIRLHLKNIRQLYSHCEKKILKKRGLVQKNSPKIQMDIQNASFSISQSQEKMVNDQEQITSLQKELQQKSIPSLENLEINFSGMKSIKSFTSFNFIENDF